MHGKKIYAAYGSNMNLAQMKRRCPAAMVIGTGILRDYRLVFRGLRRGVANIERDKGSIVPIVLWEITSQCEGALDYYEGFPKLYDKTVVSVETEKDIVNAMAYVMTSKYARVPMLPTGEYYNVIAAGYREHALDGEPLKDAFIEVAEIDLSIKTEE